MKAGGTAMDYIRAAIQTHRSHPAGPCLTEEQLWDFYAGRLGETANALIREHLASCQRCLGIARDALLFSQAMTTPAPRTERAPVEAASRFRWNFAHTGQMLLAAATIVVTLSAVLVLRSTHTDKPVETRMARATPSAARPAPPPRQNPWRDLQIPKADYVLTPASADELVWRGDSATPALDPFAEAMGSYEKNDFGEAERRLGEYSKNHPNDAMAHFYRGVSLLQLGQTAEAIGPLEIAVDLGRGTVLDDARWYLVLAQLKAGEFAKAQTQLNSLTPHHRHYAEALQLREQLNRMMSGGSAPAEGGER